MDKFYEKIDWNNFSDEVKNRVKHLNSEEYQSSRATLGNGAGSIGTVGAVSGFFASTDVIGFDSLDDGYTYNDPYMYDVLLRGYNYYRNKFPDLSPTSPEFLLALVKGTAINYYGKNNLSDDEIIHSFYNGFPDFQEEWHNQLEYLKQISKNKEDFIISVRNCFPAYYQYCYNRCPDIKDAKPFIRPMCSEYASVTQQLMNFLGIECYYVQNSMLVNNKMEGHAYNVVKFDEDYMLVDIVNKVFHKLKDEKEALDLMNGKIAVTVNTQDNSSWYYGNNNELNKIKNSGLKM